jgi:hypothetical protein
MTNLGRIAMPRPWRTQSAATRDVGDLQDNPAGYLGGGERAVDDRAVAVADREVDEGFAGQVSEGDCFPGCEAMAGRDDKI